MPSGSFTLSSWIIAERQRHHRVRDHFGNELATDVVLDEAVGRYPAETPIQSVIADLYARLIARSILAFFNAASALAAFCARTLSSAA